MPLKFSPPPADAFDALREGLRETLALQQTPGVASPAALAISAAPTATEPFPVYELGLQELTSGATFDDARLAAWRYLLVEQQQVKQAAEVTPSAGNTEFATLTTGYAAAAERGFDIADALPDVQQRDYEIRALRVPSLYVMALWLKPEQGDGDWFIPLPPVFPPFQAYATYSGGDFLRLLRDAAQVKLPQEQQVVPP